MTERIGIFADANGWRLAQPGWQSVFSTWDEARHEALRQAALARWRGESVEVLVQTHAGEALTAVDPDALKDDRPI